MKSVINNNTAAKSAPKRASCEPDRVALVDEFMASKDFDPIKSRMTPADHKSLRDRFKEKQLHSVL